MAEISDYLNGLEEHNVQEENIKLNKNPMIDLLCRNFEEYLKDNSRFHDHKNFESSAIKGLKYTSKDVTDFSLMLKQYETERNFGCDAGCFLSLLINNSKETNFEIITVHLTKAIDVIGIHNTKNIYVKGNAGSLLGREMSGGTIIVEGCTGRQTGNMLSGGKIMINGNSGELTGEDLRGGEIIVKKNVGSCTGAYMSGGIITVEGSAEEEVGVEMRGGKIVVKSGVVYGIGTDSSRGIIIVEGDIGRIHSNCRAEVYLKQKRIKTGILTALYYNRLRKNGAIRKIFG